MIEHNGMSHAKERYNFYTKLALWEFNEKLSEIRKAYGDEMVDSTIRKNARERFVYVGPPLREKRKNIDDLCVKRFERNESFEESWLLQIVFESSEEPHSLGRLMKTCLLELLPCTLDFVRIDNAISEPSVLLTVCVSKKERASCILRFLMLLDLGFRLMDRPKALPW